MPTDKWLESKGSAGLRRYISMPFSFLSPSKELMVFSKSIFKMCVSPSLAGTLSFEFFSLDDLYFCLSISKFCPVSNKGIFYFTLSASGKHLSDIWIPIHLYFLFLTAYYYTVRSPRYFLSEVLSKWWCKVSRKAIWKELGVLHPGLNNACLLCTV